MSAKKKEYMSIHNHIHTWTHKINQNQTIAILMFKSYPNFYFMMPVLVWSKLNSIPKINFIGCLVPLIESYLPRYE